MYLIMLIVLNYAMFVVQYCDLLVGLTQARSKERKYHIFWYTRNVPVSGPGGQSHSGDDAYVRLKRPPFSASLSPIDPIFFTVA